jgi:hypothetical protein
LAGKNNVKFRWTLVKAGASTSYVVIDDVLFTGTGGGVTPTVTNVTSTKADGTYGVGTSIPVTVTFSASVTVTGTPQLKLATGGAGTAVNYTSGSPGTVLTFNYTVAAGNNAADLDYVDINSLALNGGTIKATAGGLAATLTLPAPGATGSLGANKNIVIDTTAPTVTDVTSTKPDGTYGVGTLIPVTVTFSKSVIVTGTPLLTLETGTTDRNASYAGGSGSVNLIFNYTVQPGDNSKDLDYTSINSLTLSGGTIKDAAGNNATLTLPAPGAAHSLGYNKNIVIDTRPVTLRSPANGTMTNNNTPTFAWENQAVFNRYELWIDDDANFLSPIFLENTTEKTLTLPIEKSLPDDNYYWRVRGYGGTVFDSDNWTFLVDTVPPPAPSLISPGNNHVTEQTTLTFEWSSVSDDTSRTTDVSGVRWYELCVANNSDFSSPEVLENVKNTSQENTLDGGIHYWKVRAWDWVGNPSAWSETWKFTMENFTLSTVDQIMIAQGTDKSIAVSVQLTLGVPSTVSLSGAWIDTPPSGVTPSFSPASGTMTFYSTLTFSTIVGATTGTFTYRITATSANGIIRTSDVEVSITTMVFSVDVSSRIISLMRSDEATLDVSVVIEEGVPENVLLSGSWIVSTPSGVDTSFAPTSGLPTFSSAFSSVLSFTTTNAAVDGSFTYQVKGTTEGGVAATVDVTVNISTVITITVATDNASYEKMQIITLSGTAMDPENDLVGSGTATISIVSGVWSQTFQSTITDGVYSLSYTITLDNPENTWTISVSAVDSYGNETSAPVSVEVKVTYPSHPFYIIAFLSPFGGQVFLRGQAVTVSVQITDSENPDTKVSGVNVVLTTPIGDNALLAEGSLGTYSVAYTLRMGTPTGNLSMTVLGEKTVDGVLMAGTNVATVKINPATLVLRLTSPTKREFEAGETVKVEVQASYSDGSSVDEGIIFVNRPRGDNLQLTAEWSGVYGATYIIGDDEVGTWDIRISAADAYGNSASVVAGSTVIGGRGLSSNIIRYWPVVLAAVLGLVTASAFAAHGHLRTRRLGAIKREKQQIEKLKKEVGVDYFTKGSIPRETYDNLTKEYATKLTNLDKEERLLIDKMKKKKLSEKKKKLS